MTPAREAWIPDSLDEALAIRAEHAERGASPVRPVAGGTDLMVQFRRHAPVPVELDATPLFVTRVPELRAIRRHADAWSIGAAVTLRELACHELCDGNLGETLRWFASPAIRNVATIGGNVCNASPAGDLLPWLLVRDAELLLASRRGRRTVAVADFVVAPGRTTLAPDELLVALLVPDRAGRERGDSGDADGRRFSWYRKVSPRRSNALAKLSVCAEASRTRDGRLARLAMGIGAVAPTPIRVPEAETMLAGASAADLRPAGSGGRPARSSLVTAALAAYENHIRPIDDQRSTAGYRRRTTLRLIADLLERRLTTYLEQP